MIDRRSHLRKLTEVPTLANSKGVAEFLEELALKPTPKRRKPFKLTTSANLLVAGIRRRAEAEKADKQGGLRLPNIAELPNPELSGVSYSTEQRLTLSSFARHAEYQGWKDNLDDDQREARVPIPGSIGGIKEGIQQLAGARHYLLGSRPPVSGYKAPSGDDHRLVLSPHSFETLEKEYRMKQIEEGEKRYRDLFGPRRWANGYGSGERGFDEEAGPSRVEFSQIAKRVASQHELAPHRFKGLIDYQVLDDFVAEAIHKALANYARNNAFG